MARRILLFLAAAFCLAGCRTPADDPSVTKVLMIGNSFSLPLMKHLPHVAKDRGVDLDLASLYIGGCSLERHCKNIARADEDDFRPYRFDRTIKGTKTVNGAKINIPEALELAKWDVVTIQQASHESWKPESYEPYGDNLIETIRRHAPQARIVVQETWSYTPWDKRLKEWHLTPDAMYAQIHKTIGAFASARQLAVIPMGAAVQEWRTRLPVTYAENSFGGDVVGGRGQKPRDQFKRDARYAWVPNCDVFHLNEKGEYLQALVWAAQLLDIDLHDLDYRPTDVTEDEARLMREIAAEVR